MRSSVVDVIINRQIAGRMPPMEVHFHSDRNLVMLWNRDDSHGCFKNCILRFTIDDETVVQLKKFLTRYLGDTQFCKFGYMCLTNDIEPYTHMARRREHLPRPIRLAHSLQLQWVRDASDIDCTCPETTLREYDRGEPMTSDSNSAFFL
jgi:hypothetical protein